jgi:hypothetical protein
VTAATIVNVIDPKEQRIRLAAACTTPAVVLQHAHTNQPGATAVRRVLQ